MQRILAIAVLTFLYAGVLPAEEFTRVLWNAAEPVYEKTLEHPFLTGLSDGTLPKRRFQFYLVQDSQYLRVFGQALSLLAAKAPDEAWAATLNQHAIDTLKAEGALHDSILRSYGVNSRDAAAAGMAPTAVAYTNHILATASQRPFIEGLAAVLPCYWIYEKVGKHLAVKGSPAKEYNQWIAMYGDDSFAASVAAVLQMMNETALRDSDEGKRRAVEQFLRSARYEYQFWDMAWREERWLP